MRSSPGKGTLKPLWDDILDGDGEVSSFAKGLINKISVGERDRRGGENFRR